VAVAAVNRLSKTQAAARQELQPEVLRPLVIQAHQVTEALVVLALTIRPIT
jgi:hypothetical protein